VTEPPDVQVSIPAKPEYVALARHVLGATARLGGLSPDCVDNVKLAVSEATTNAVSVAGKARSSHPVEISGDLEGDRLRIEVGDQGEYPDPASIPAPEEAASLDFSFARGLSLPLLQGLVDELEIVPREEGGTLVRMTMIDQGPEEEGAAG